MYCISFAFVCLFEFFNFYQAERDPYQAYSGVIPFASGTGAQWLWPIWHWLPAAYKLQLNVKITKCSVLMCWWQRVIATVWVRQVQYVTSPLVSARVVITYPVNLSWPAIRPWPTRAARCVRLTTTDWRLVKVVRCATVTRMAAVHRSAQRKVSVRVKRPS